MLVIKNTFVFLGSILAICLLIITFDKIGMNRHFNILFSAFLYGVFITTYFKTIGLSLICIFLFYGFLLLLTESFEVFEMFSISCLALCLIKMIMPKLKYKDLGNTFLTRKL